MVGVKKRKAKSGVKMVDSEGTSRITMIHPGMHQVGGAERLITDLAIGLAEEGCKVDLLVGACNKLWYDQLRRKNSSLSVKEVGVKFPGNPLTWINLEVLTRSLFRLINPDTDTIFTSGFPSNLILNYSNRLRARHIHYFQEAPTILHDREGQKATNPFYLPIFYRFMTRLYGGSDIRCVRNYDVLMANSNLTRRINAQVYGLDPADIKVVYPGINIKKFERPISATPFFSRIVKKSSPVIFFPKGTKFWWNQLVCLKALERLRNVDFIAVFTGGTWFEVKSLAMWSKKLGISQKILWAQVLSEEELRFIYSRSTIVVSIPRRQPFGLTPLESIICGSTPITSRHSGLFEIMKLEDSANFVDGNDSIELAQTMEKLITDEDLRRKIVFDGRLKIVEEFDGSKFINRMIKVLLS